MPTRTQQAELLSMAYASHGDTKHIILFPCNPEECFYMSVKAFDLADRFQTPVFVASDLDIGMNDWMCKRLQWDDSFRPDRGKCLTADELESVKKFSRSSTRKGDGIRGAVAARRVHGRRVFRARLGSRQAGTYTEDADAYQEVVDRLARKFRPATAVPAPEFAPSEGPGWGSYRWWLSRRCARGDRSAATWESRRLHAHQGAPIDAPVREFLDSHA
jgi:2-oxoglutarate ferredoxin oxidoreductase subunit alpha